MKRRYRTTIGKYMKDLDMMLEAQKEEDRLYRMTLFEALRELPVDIKDMFDTAIWSYCKEKAIHSSHIATYNKNK
jgi:hypothetical protein